jgi:Fe-S-cluster-containing hydrogenase component 2
VGETLFCEGDKVDGLYLIRRGSVTISRKISGNEVVLAYVSAGNYVGEMALLSNTPRVATVRAASPTDVILLDAEHVRAVIERNTSLRSKLDASYLERITVDALPTDEAFSFSRLVNFLMKNGVGEATDVLLIDYDRCIHCNDCESACAAAHDGVSQLNREAGATHAQIHLPVSCRHCEHPHCMKDCPPNAIQRAVNGEVYIADSCIGCGNCQKNCPYGVIQMTTPGQYQPSNFWQALLKNATPAQKPATLGPAQKAVKCDLCQGIDNGPLCVNACPTGAAFRINPEGFFQKVGREVDLAERMAS